MRALARLLAIAALAGAAFTGLIGYRSWSFGVSLLHPPRAVVQAAPTLEGLEVVELTEPNGTVLRGWWVPSKNRAAVVLCHGFASNRAQLSAELQLLARHGYGVLAFDLPGHGASGGELVTWGDREQASLAAAIGFVARQAGVDPQRIGALGFSMGGTTVVEVAVVDPRLKAIAITGTSTSLTDELDNAAGKWGPLSQIPAKLAMKRGGVDFDRVHPVDVICKVAPRPILIVQGTDDDSTPAHMGQQLFAAACEPKTWWLVPGAHHGDYATIDLPGYEQRLVALFDGSLLK